MGLFDSAEEYRRKDNLKKLEDKRVAMAQQLAARGFAPERMLFAQNENGGFTALSRFNGQYWVIVSPGFGTDDEYVLEISDTLNWRSTEINVKAEGMGGIFGFGRKGQHGREYIITLQDGTEAKMPFVGGLNCWMEASLAKNPLLKTQRRRGDANLVWDMRPIDLSTAAKVLEIAAEYFPT